MIEHPALLAIFPVLALLALIVAWAFVFRFSFGMLRSGRLSLADHKLPIAVGFIATGLFLEAVWEGIDRFAPALWDSVGWSIHLVGFHKLLFVAGLTFLLAWVIKALTDESRLGECVLWVASAYVACWAFFVIW